MKFLVMGSLNYDYVYELNHIVQPGETVASVRMETLCGGKGLNQSIALAKAGSNVWQGGMIGEDGELLVNTAVRYGVGVEYLKIVSGRSGHAVIQVDANGQNSIVLYGGSNRKFTEEYIRETLEHFESGDYLVLQNEINRVNEVIREGYARRMKIVLNPSPYDAEILSWDLSKVSVFFLNEIEGEQMTGTGDVKKMIAILMQHYPEAEIILTLGEKGAFYGKGEQRFFQPAFPVKVVDTTAAGDTFTGYFLAARSKGFSAKKCLEIAAHASAFAVGKRGAAPSIPLWKEVVMDTKLRQASLC